MWNSLMIPWRFAALDMLSITRIMPVLVLPSFNTQQTPTKYLYGHKYAVYNKQF